jgi:hypothetical protein
MEMQLGVHNCIGIRQFAVAHSLQELATKAQEFMEKNVTQVFETEEFLQLDIEQLVELLASDELNVEKEEVRMLSCFFLVLFLFILVGRNLKQTSK